jgi:hypothetical protein
MAGRTEFLCCGETLKEIEFNLIRRLRFLDPRMIGYAASQSDEL